MKREEVEAIARLARLELTGEEIERIGAELSGILEHFAALAELDTDGVEPMTHAVPMELRLRADELEPSLAVERVMAGAPDAVDDCFRVPKIIDTSGSES